MRRTAPCRFDLHAVRHGIRFQNVMRGILLCDYAADDICSMRPAALTLRHAWTSHHTTMTADTA